MILAVLPGPSAWATGSVEPRPDQATGDNSFFHTNHLGTSRAMTDDLGASQTTFVYTAFGERVDSNGFVTRYGYVGQHGYEAFDPPIGGFLHVGARWYDPETGRFLQRDPIGIKGGMNVYTYAKNTPSKRIDPTGLRYDMDGPGDGGGTGGGGSGGGKGNGNGGSGGNKSGPGLAKTAGRLIEVIRVGIISGIRTAGRAAAAAASRVNPTPIFAPYLPTCAPTLNTTYYPLSVQEGYDDEQYGHYGPW